MKIYKNLWKRKARPWQNQFVGLSTKNEHNKHRISTSSRQLGFPKHGSVAKLNRIIGKHVDFKKCLQLNKSRAFGRYITTTQPLSVGEVAIVTVPFASAVERVKDIPYCLTCHETDNDFLTCQKCSMVFYCNLKCKKANNTHKFECGTRFHKILDLDVKCAIQMVFEMMATFKCFEELRDFIQQSVENWHGIPNTKNIRESMLYCITKLQLKTFKTDEEKVEIHKVASYAYELIATFPEVRSYFKLDNNVGSSFLQHRLAHNISVIIQNGFQINLSANGRECERILIYDVLSFFNHSCSPNLLNYIEGNVMTCITSQRIQPGEQLFIAYRLFKKETKFERQRKLRLWNFACHCVRCVYGREISNTEFRRADVMTKRNIEKVLNKKSCWTPQKGAYINRYSHFVCS